MSYRYFPIEFSSYEDYVKYLKEKGFVIEAPDGIYNIEEVDLEEEIRKWQQKHFEGIGYVLDGLGGWIGKTSLLDIARYFFELGIKSKGE